MDLTNFDTLEYLFNDFISQKYATCDKKKIANLKYRIKNGFNNDSCRVANEYKTFIKINQKSLDQDKSELQKSVKLEGMTEIEKEAFLSMENLKKIKEIQTNKIILKKKYNRHFNNLNISCEKVFESLYTHDNPVKINDLTPELLDSNCDEVQLCDGRLTFTLQYLIEYDEEFEEKFNMMYKFFIYKNKKLTCDYDDFISIMISYYDYIRNEFESKLIIESKNWRETELSMMPKRQTGMTYSEWLKAMGNAGFYCGMPHPQFLGPISDLDAWIFIGKKINERAE